MSDIRGIPRRSKTAVLVVLVVFLQMLALSVVGIGAIKEDRERGRQTRIRENEDEARLAVTRVRQDTLNELAGILRQALDAESWARLREDRQTWPAPLVRQVFHYYPSYSGSGGGSIVWLDPAAFVLYEPPDAIRASSKSYAARPADVAAADPYADDKPRDMAPGERLALFLNALRSFPLLVQETEAGGSPWPVAAGWANALFDDGILLDAARSRLGGVDGRTVRSAVLQSLVVAGLNEGRPEFDAAGLRLIRGIEPKVLAALPKMPEVVRGDLAEEVRDFQAHRAFLANPETRGYLLSFVTAGRELGVQLGASMPYLRESGTELFAMKIRGNVTLRIARLDIEVLDRWMRTRVAAARFRQWGMELRVRERGGAEEATPADVLIVEPIEDGELRLPFELALFKVADVVGEGEGQSEVWYWAIICLAALGLGFGAIILVRLWRREVRLAQLKADFVSNLSHELKTPLTSISLFTEMLRDGKFEGAPEDQAEAYAVLDQEAQRLQRIVRRMIDTARNEAQGVAYALGPGDLNRPVLEATNRFRRIVTEPGLDLSITLAPEPLPMMLDASAMDDVVTNLLTNAWKYKRGDAARVVVETARRGRKAEIIVSDDGIGIPRGDRKRVFETFFRSEQYLTQPVQGTGLGLALVRTVVRAHKGSIRVVPGDDGVGTTFRIRFPLSRKAAYAAANPSVGEENDQSDDNGSEASARSPEGVENTGATA